MLGGFSLATGPCCLLLLPLLLVTGRYCDAQDRTRTTLWPVLLSRSAFFSRAIALSSVFVSLAVSPAGCYPSGEEVSRRIGGLVPRCYLLRFSVSFIIGRERASSRSFSASFRCSLSTGRLPRRSLDTRPVNQLRDTDTTVAYPLSADPFSEKAKRSKDRPSGRVDAPFVARPAIATTRRDATRRDHGRGYTALGFCAIQDIAGPLPTAAGYRIYCNFNYSSSRVICLVIDSRFRDQTAPCLHVCTPSSATLLYRVYFPSRNPSPRLFFLFSYLVSLALLRSHDRHRSSF